MLCLRFRWALGLAAALVSAVGCGDGASSLQTDTDASTAADGSLSHGDRALPDDSAFGEAGTGAPCGYGAGRLRVAIALDPALERRGPDVWLALHCDGQDRALRVVRWDRSMSEVIDGLGPGRYRLFGSSFVAPGVWSSPVEVSNDSTVAVPMTLPLGGAVLGAVSMGDFTPSRGGALIARKSLRPAGVTAEVGSLEVTVTAIENSPEVSVHATVVNTCRESCPTVVLQSVEARSRMGMQPLDLAVGTFDRDAPLEPGQSVSLPVELRLTANMPDRDVGLSVVVMGQIATGAVSMRQ